MTESDAITDALHHNRTPLPAGFAFRVVQRITEERILRAEAAGRRQSHLVTMGLILLAVAAINLMKVVGLGDVQWVHQLPMNFLVYGFFGWVGFVILDRCLASTTRDPLGS